MFLHNHLLIFKCTVFVIEDPRWENDWNSVHSEFSFFDFLFTSCFLFFLKTWISVHDMQLRNSSAPPGCSRVGTTALVGPIGASFPKIKIKYTYFFPPERKSQIHFFLRKVRTPARVNMTEHNTLTPDGLKSLQWDSCHRKDFIFLSFERKMNFVTGSEF